MKRSTQVLIVGGAFVALIGFVMAVFGVTGGAVYLFAFMPPSIAWALLKRKKDGQERGYGFDCLMIVLGGLWLLLAGILLAVIRHS